jgi:hypothetical protein
MSCIRTKWTTWPKRSSWRRVVDYVPNANLCGKCTVSYLVDLTHFFAYPDLDGIYELDDGFVGHQSHAHPLIHLTEISIVTSVSLIRLQIQTPAHAGCQVRDFAVIVMEVIPGGGCRRQTQTAVPAKSAPRSCAPIPVLEKKSMARKIPHQLDPRASPA